MKNRIILLILLVHTAAIAQEVDWGKTYIYNDDSNELLSIDNKIRLTLLYSMAIAIDRWCNDILPQLKEENYENIGLILHNKV